MALVGRLASLVEAANPSPLHNPNPELLGPKTAEVPEAEMLPSAKMDDLLDISPKAPPEVHQKIRELVSHYREAFRFDDCLGKPQVEIKIDVMPGAHPILLQMYGASSQKREMINAQIDK